VYEVTAKFPAYLPNAIIKPMAQPLLNQLSEALKDFKPVVND